MNTHALIDAVVQQTTVFLAQLATAGGVRAPLAGVADQVFLELTNELQNQGVSKKVIADMFGMALRTYHRRVRELHASRTELDRTLWEVVLCFVRERERVSAREIVRRFRNDDPEILTGVLNDLVGSALVYRAGVGDGAVYRIADEADFAELDEERRRELNEYLVWLTVYRNGPITAARIASLSRLSVAVCGLSLNTLVADGRIQKSGNGELVEYESQTLLVPLGTSQGWEVAVLDHFQAVVSAISSKLLLRSSRSSAGDVIGGSTWSLDVWEGHPLESEALGTLGRIRNEIEELRKRVDAFNTDHSQNGPRKRVVCYTGQYVQQDGFPPETMSADKNG